MRKREGYREISFYLPEEVYLDLEKYWRYHTTYRAVSAAATELLTDAIEKALDTKKPQD